MTKPTGKATMSCDTFVQEMAQKCAPLEQKLCRLYWQLATTGDATVAKELSETEKTLKILFSNPDEFKQLKKWEDAGIADELLARQIHLLIKAYTPNQLDEKTISDLVERQTELENIFNNFRAELDGKKRTNNDLKEILKTEKGGEARKKVWEASRQISLEVADKIRELAKKRNAAAKKLGFENHFVMALTLQELDSQWLFGLFDRLKKETEGAFSKKIQNLHEKLGHYYGIATSDVKPWHYDDPFAQAAPSQVTIDLDPFLKGKDILKICREFYDSIGLDISDVLERSDLFEKEGKSQHAFCISMSKEAHDVRVLANIRPNSYWASTMLHELGHASYSKNIDYSLPYFLRDEAHIFATEAIAMLMERMMHHPHWLKNMVGLSDGELKTVKGDLSESLALANLIIAPGGAGVSTF